MGDKANRMSLNHLLTLVELSGACWLWRGPKNGNGYGTISVDGKRIPATHYSFFLHEGKWPDVLLRHTCDTPLCVNHGHLLEGTDADNAADRVARGRTAKGSQNGNAVLTEIIVKEIKAQKRSGLSVKQISKEHGIPQQTLYSIFQGKTWSHVT